MKRTSALGVFVLALAVVFVASSVPGVYAQDPKGGGGVGSGSPRAGGGDGGGARSGGSAAPAPAPTSSGSSGGGTTWSGGGGSPAGMSAVPRGAGGAAGNAGDRQGGGSRRWSGGGPAAGWEGRSVDVTGPRRSATDDQMAGRPRLGSASSGVESSVPWYSRPRGGNPATGTAVARPDTPVRPPGGGSGYPGYPWYPGYGYGYWGGYYDCYYYPYGCGNAWGYGGFGLGYFYFDPFGWNYGDSAWWGYGGGGGGGSSYGGQQMGSIRLRVQPSNASVYVDGYYAGRVDDYDNAFQKLSVAIGTHRIEISAPGYRPLVIDIDVRDFETINYEGRLEPIR